MGWGGVGWGGVGWDGGGGGTASRRSGVQECKKEQAPTRALTATAGGGDRTGDGRRNSRGPGEEHATHLRHELRVRLPFGWSVGRLARIRRLDKPPPVGRVAEAQHGAQHVPLGGLGILDLNHPVPVLWEGGGLLVTEGWSREREAAPPERVEETLEGCGKVSQLAHQAELAERLECAPGGGDRSHHATYEGWAGWG